jgi:DNA gyrase subunit A
VHELPQAGRAARGKAIVNLVPLGADEKIAALLPVKELTAVKKEDEDAPEAAEEPTAAEEAGGDEDVEESEAARVAAKALQVAAGPYIIFVTQNGLIKRTKLQAFARPRPSGLKALSIEENDELVSVMHANGDEDVIIGTAQGMAIRFDQKEVRAMGRGAFGVKGITLESGDHVVGAELAKPGTTLLTVSENGYGKRTAIEEYRLTHRGGKGVIDIKTGDRNGNVVATLQVTDADQVMLITNKGTLIRSRVADISIIGRNTQGVRVMALSQEGEKVVGSTRAPEEREADAAAAVAADQVGGEDDDGSPPDGEE